MPVGPAAATVPERVSACSSERMPWLLISRVGILSLRRVPAAAVKSGTLEPCKAREIVLHTHARGRVADGVRSSKTAILVEDWMGHG